MEVLVDINISGHLLLDLLKVVDINGEINVALVIDQHITLSLRLWETITSVKVMLMEIGGVDIIHSIPAMSSGMVRTVDPPAHAVSSTTPHGLQRTCLLQQLMTLN